MSCNYKKRKINSNIIVHSQTVKKLSILKFLSEKLSDIKFKKKLSSIKNVLYVLF